MTNDKYSEITSLHRDDLAEYFSEEEIATLSADDMADIAEQMAECYTESGAFWDDMEYATRVVLDEKAATASA